MLGVGLVLESWVIVFKANMPFFFFSWLVGAYSCPLFLCLCLFPFLSLLFLCKSASDTLFLQ